MKAFKSEAERLSTKASARAIPSMIGSTVRISFIRGASFVRISIWILVFGYAGMMWAGRIEEEYTRSTEARAAIPTLESGLEISSFAPAGIPEADSLSATALRISVIGGSESIGHTYGTQQFNGVAAELASLLGERNVPALVLDFASPGMDPVRFRDQFALSAALGVDAVIFTESIRAAHILFHEEMMVLPHVTFEPNPSEPEESPDRVAGLAESGSFALPSEFIGGRLSETFPGFAGGFQNSLARFLGMENLAALATRGVVADDSIREIKLPVDREQVEKLRDPEFERMCRASLSSRAPCPVSK